MMYARQETEWAGGKSLGDELHWSKVSRLVDLDGVSICKRLQDGFPAPQVLVDIRAQSDNQGTVLSLSLAIFLWIGRKRGNMPGAEAVQRMLKVSFGDLWATIGQHAILYHVRIYPVLQERVLHHLERGVLQEDRLRKLNEAINDNKNVFLAGFCQNMHLL